MDVLTRMSHSTVDAYSTAIIAQGNLGDGRIDNFIIDSSVHLGLGVAVLVTLLCSLCLVGWDALRNQPITRWSKLSILLTQITLTLQVLLGIKLLDQGQGISQLYIHYMGGLIPLGTFLAAGWLARGDKGRSSRILAALIGIGLLSATMAFFIGRAYVNG